MKLSIPILVFENNFLNLTQVTWRFRRLLSHVSKVEAVLPKQD